MAVRWYLRYGLSYRDVDELLAERGIEVDHVTIYRWVQRFTPLLVDAARPCRHAPGDRWFADETSVKVAGRWVYLYRAIDQYGQVIDVLVSEKRDLEATRRFFTRALEHGTRPAGRICFDPAVPERMLPLRIENLRLAGRRLTLDVGVDAWHVEGLPEGVTQCSNATISKSKSSL